MNFTSDTLYAVDLFARVWRLYCLMMSVTSVILTEVEMSSLALVPLL